MKRLVLITVLCMFAANSRAVEDMRLWTSAAGKKIVAAFVSESNGNVTLKNESNQQFNILKNSLSKADIGYINATVMREKLKKNEPVELYNLRGLSFCITPEGKLRIGGLGHAPGPGGGPKQVQHDIEDITFFVNKLGQGKLWCEKSIEEKKSYKGAELFSDVVVKHTVKDGVLIDFLSMADELNSTNEKFTDADINEMVLLRVFVYNNAFPFTNSFPGSIRIREIEPLIEILNATPFSEVQAAAKAKAPQPTAPEESK